MYQNTISSTSVNSPILESHSVSSDVDFASKLSYDTINKLAPLTENLDNNHLIYSSTKCDREHQIDHMSENNNNIQMINKTLNKKNCRMNENYIFQIGMFLNLNKSIMIAK